MATADLVHASCAPFGFDHRTIVEASGVVSLATQRKALSNEQVRGHVDSFLRVAHALKRASVELINENNTRTANGSGLCLMQIKGATL
ncbi:MAG: hypothetical protein B7X35_05010 [Halothiobacillus sp. 14-56-357]|jgi:hypothetical protein|uniref:hypothetical protein n=1 Tax=Halothiobacillus sp. 15-55-196 TaxID=1970382 RepID=UPI000BCD4BBA|nr:hypothetical protein [Halothiobacillus sp. 15-55-196]OZB37695.1 MAG: hypothetical protein B7X44_00940 [Halothiobacillus sp. 15-55-196]OZB56557.1 MAG: hypothetical protein B7X35_05010 [Halothiobacillus sp. 14-56-357]OZB77583.1 MAG: hypothetical protein B7X29_08035 [Halothiobacillus sp. 13-55-115]